MELGIEAAQDRVLEALRQQFRPEFLNRVDEIVVFHSLSRDDLARIVDIQLEQLEARLADRKLTLTLTDAARRFLAERGYDPVFGARPLKRAIQHDLQDALAMAMLEGEFGEGDTVRVDAAGDKLVFQRAAVAPEAARRPEDDEVKVVEGEIVD
jgi:ATP-dependent Clp protease ATP-binding subunit ClpB